MYIIDKENDIMIEVNKVYFNKTFKRSSVLLLKYKILEYCEISIFF
jgi:hypothetical protein